MAWSAQDAQGRITDALLAQVPDIEGRRWDLANPYILRHLATHAAAAGRLGELVNDSNYLLYADPQNLRRALTSVVGRGRPLVRLYLRCVDEFSGIKIAERAAIMQGVALRDEPEALPLLRGDAELPWRGVWSAGLCADFHQRLPSHASPVTSVTFGRSGMTTLVATGAGDGVIRLWNPETGERWGRFNNRSGTVFSLAFHAGQSESLVIAGGQDGSVTFWDLERDQMVRSVTAHDGPVFAVALAHAGSLLATAGEDGLIRLWNRFTGQAVGMLAGHLMPIRALAFGNVDGRAILVSGGDDGRVRIWDTQEHLQIHSFAGMGWIYSAAIGTRGGQSLLATGSAFGTVGLWDLRTSAHTVSFEGHQGAVGAVAFGELDGRLTLATGGDDGAVRLWDPRNGQLQKTLTRSTTQHFRRPTDNSDHTILALGAGNTADQPDESPNDVVTGVGRARSVQAIAWGKTAGAPLVASADGDWTARLWEPSRDAANEADPKGRRLGLVRSLAAGHAHGYPLLVEGCQDGTARLRDVSSGWELRVFTAHRSPITATSTALIDGRPIIANGDEDGRVLLHDAMTGELLQTISVRTRQARAAYVHDVLLAEIDQQSTVVITANGIDPVTLWDPRTGKEIGTIDRSKDSWRLALGRIKDRPVLISARRTPGGGEVLVTELASRSQTTLEGHEDSIQAVAFTDVAGKPLAATGSRDGTIRVWDLAKSQCVHKLPGQSPIRALAFGRLDQRPLLVSGVEDCSVRLWDPTTGGSLGRLADHAEPITAVTTFEDGVGHPLICTGAQDGVHLMRLSPAVMNPVRPDIG